MNCIGREFDLTNITRNVRSIMMLTAACLWLGWNNPASAQTTAATTDAPSDKSGEVLEKMRAGGQVIYLRHTQTDSATQDGDLSDMSDCSQQRLLSAEGRATATSLGEAFAALKIPVDTVITSQFCRAKETAKLMGFTATKETADLNNDTGEPAVSKEESDRRTAALRKLLAQAPAAGKNTLIVGHVPNIRVAVSLDYAKMKEGEVAVFTPEKSDAGYKAAGRMTPDELFGVAKTASK